MAKVEEHFAGFGHEQDSFVFAVGEIFGMNGSGIAIAEIYFAAGLFRDACNERDLGAAFLDAIFKCADAANVRRMSQHTPGILFEFLPLLQEVITTMVANFFDDF